MKTMAHKTQSKSRFVIRTLFSLVPLSAFLSAWSARAQEGVLDDIANNSSARAEQAQQKAQNYTIKYGDFKMLITPSLSLQWDDNINLAETGKEDDFIVLPTVGLAMSYPLPVLGVLQFSVTAGYSEYTLHPDLSSWYVAPQVGSGLSFNMHIKDILINLHDQFSYLQYGISQQNTAALPQSGPVAGATGSGTYQTSAQNGEVAGTGNYGTFENTVGLSARWSLKRVDLTVGYDHQNSIATTSQFNNTDNGSDDAYSRVGYKWNSKLTTGLEGTTSFTAFNQNVLNDTTSYSLGLYADWRPDAFLEIEPRVGYTINQYSQTSSVQTSDINSWYADLSVSHRITRSLIYSLGAGKNVGGGVQSTADVYWYVNTGITWKFIRNFSFQPQIFFQHGNQGGGSTLTPLGMTNPNLLPSNGEIYDYYGGSLGINYAITRQFTLGWNYQFTQRTSSLPDRGYTQNIIGIQITYHPI